MLDMDEKKLPKADDSISDTDYSDYLRSKTIHVMGSIMTPNCFVIMLKR